MSNEDMIRELRNVANKYRGKVVHTGEVNITLMCEEVAKRLEELSQPKTDWIPCEEGLPSEYGQYLYTDKNDEVHEGTYCPPIQGMIRGWSTCEAEGFVKLSDDEVIAWQPLPQPYKKEGAENE